MQKPIRVEKVRVARFDFEPLRAIKAKVDEKPELEESLRRDFQGTLKAEGVKINKTFLTEIEKDWRTQISNDIKAKVASTPEKYPLLKRVIEGKPIRVHVKVDKKGRHLKTKEGSY